MRQLSILNEAIQIDKGCYPDEYVGDYSNVLNRYNAFPEGLITRVESGRVVAYVSIFPVNKETDKLIRTSKSIVDDTICNLNFSEADEAETFYLISIAVDTNNRNRGLAQSLMKEAIDSISKYKNVKCILCSTISEDGSRITDKFKFKTIAINEGFKVRELKLV